MNQVNRRTRWIPCAMSLAVLLSLAPICRADQGPEPPFVKQDVFGSIDASFQERTLTIAFNTVDEGKVREFRTLIALNGSREFCQIGTPMKANGRPSRYVRKVTFFLPNVKSIDVCATAYLDDAQWIAPVRSPVVPAVMVGEGSVEPGRTADRDAPATLPGIHWAGWYRLANDDAVVFWSNAHEEEVDRYQVLLMDDSDHVLSCSAVVYRQDTENSSYQALFQNIPFHQGELRTAIRVHKEDGSFETTRSRPVAALMGSTPDGSSFSSAGGEVNAEDIRVEALSGFSEGLCWNAALDSTTGSVLFRWSLSDEENVASYTILLLNGPRRVLASERGILPDSGIDGTYEAVIDRIPFHKEPLFAAIRATDVDGTTRMSDVRMVRVIMGADLSVDCSPDAGGLTY